MQCDDAYIDDHYAQSGDTQRDNHFQYSPLYRPRTIWLISVPSDHNTRIPKINNIEMILGRRKKYYILYMTISKDFYY